MAIATPVATHYEFARKALEHGKHVLVEKPIAASVAEAESLIDIAAKHRPDADGEPHLHLYRRGAQDEGDHRPVAIWEICTTSIPYASISASSSTTSTCSGIWHRMTSPFWTISSMNLR